MSVAGPGASEPHHDGVGILLSPGRATDHGECRLSGQNKGYRVPGGGGSGTSLSLEAQLPAADNEIPVLSVIGVFDGSNSIDVSRFGGDLPTFEGYSMTLTRSG